MLMRPPPPEHGFNFGVILPKEGEVMPLAREFIDCLKSEIDNHLVAGSVERI
ncbi:MAG: hypothetical protein H6R17_2728 [Proteobacteria bacterium]|nr:hypothetical protein [Pseudomonadota bacterium]